MDKTTVKERARDELRNYAIVSGYLFVCFAVLWFYETTWSEDRSVVASLTAVAVKALIFGKFILLGEAVGVGRSALGPHLLASIIGKAAQFLALLIVLTIAEEILVGMYHGETFSQTIAGFEQHTMLQILAKCLLALLILLPLIATKEISRTLGPGKLRAMLLGTHPGPS